MAIDPELLEILVCPESRAPLFLDGDWLVSTDASSRRRYRVEDDLPDLILEDSEVLSEEDWAAAARRAGILPANEGDAS